MLYWNSLSVLAKKHQFNIGSFSTGFHILFKQISNWASYIINQ
ncbi:hypothetical protein [uncultured Gammaproteobacteria bacterium]|nr:hypothetical protein [uncultured Gammaproteobacteria bacterium]